MKRILASLKAFFPATGHSVQDHDQPASLLSDLLLSETSSSHAYQGLINRKH